MTRLVAPSIDGDTARGELTRRRRRRWSLRRRDAGRLGDKRLPHLELLWLPFLYAEDEGGRACAVCASTGIAARVEPGGARFTEDTAAVPPGAVTIDRLTEIASGHLARQAALAGTPPSPPCRVEDWAFPFWVLHYERRPGRLDFIALDATSGARVGGAVRQALLHALLEGTIEGTAATDPSR